MSRKLKLTVMELYLDYMKNAPYRRLDIFVAETLKNAGIDLSYSYVDDLLRSNSVRETIAAYQELAGVDGTRQNAELKRNWERLIATIQEGHAISSAAIKCNVHTRYWYTTLSMHDLADQFKREARIVYQKIKRDESVKAELYQRQLKKRLSAKRNARAIQCAKQLQSIGIDCLHQLLLLIDVEEDCEQALRTAGYMRKYASQAESWAVLVDVLTAHLQSLEDGTHSINDIAITKRNGTYSVYSRHYFNARSLASALTR